LIVVRRIARVKLREVKQRRSPAPPHRRTAISAAELHAIDPLKHATQARISQLFVSQQLLSRPDARSVQITFCYARVLDFESGSSSTALHFPARPE
jgi:hypothetical protein